MQMQNKNMWGIKAWFCRGVVSSIAVSQRLQRLGQECTETSLQTLKLLAFGLLLFSVSSLIHFLHPFLSLPSPVSPLTLPIFHSIHPCSAGVSLHENNHGLCVCVCVCVYRRERERDRKKSGRDNGVVPCSVNDTPSQNRSNTQLLYNFLRRN